MTLIHSGSIDEVIYARLDPGADLLESLWEVCREKEVRTGVLMDATGSMEKLVLQRYPRTRHPQEKGFVSTDVIEMNDGPFEFSGHGLIGEGWVEGTPSPKDEVYFQKAGFMSHQSPYIHVHLVASNAETTVCGHLMRGSQIKGDTRDTPDKSHFTVVIAKVSGVRMRAVMKPTPGAIAYYHDLIKQ